MPTLTLSPICSSRFRRSWSNLPDAFLGTIAWFSARTTPFVRLVKLSLTWSKNCFVRESLGHFCAYKFCCTQPIINVPCSFLRQCQSWRFIWVCYRDISRRNLLHGITYTVHGTVMWPHNGQSQFIEEQAIYWTEKNNVDQWCYNQSKSLHTHTHTQKKRKWKRVH